MRAVSVFGVFAYLGSFATYQYVELLITEFVVFFFIRTAFDGTVDNIVTIRSSPSCQWFQ